MAVRSKRHNMRETRTHVYFLSGPFSQWDPSPFEARIEPEAAPLRFTHAEQYMMAAKAALFGDSASFGMIMAARNPWEQKKLGKSVAGFDKAKWEAEARAIVFRGNWAKFEQNDDHRTALIGSGSRLLVEGADYDPVWGAGLGWDDPLIEDERNWKGTNWLGGALMEVRYWMNALMDMQDARPGCSFDPWKKAIA